jgi:hypothetical protein
MTVKELKEMLDNFDDSAIVELEGDWDGDGSIAIYDAVAFRPINLIARIFDNKLNQYD